MRKTLIFVMVALAASASAATRGVVSEEFSTLS